RVVERLREIVAESPRLGTSGLSWAGSLPWEVDLATKSQIRKSKAGPKEVGKPDRLKPRRQRPMPRVSPVGVPASNSYCDGADPTVDLRPGSGGDRFDCGAPR